MKKFKESASVPTKIEQPLDTESIMEQGPGVPIRIDQLAPDIALFDLSNLRVDYPDIELLEELGKGSFGVVHRGLWKGSEVAVKKIIFSDQNEEEREKQFNEFRQEVWITSGLRHPNIVMMKGYCQSPLALLLEFVPCGELFNLINNLEIDISEQLRVKIAADIASGCHFLHSIRPPLIHCDLKSPNVLLMSTVLVDGPIAKVADFGTSMRPSASKIRSSAKTEQVVNPIWKAPEILRGEQFSTASDVYSFGIIMWELIARQLPFKDLPFNHQIEEKVLKGERPQIPNNCPSYWSTLMNQCWDNDPKRRPSFAKISATLMSIFDGLKKQATALPTVGLSSRKLIQASKQASPAAPSLKCVKKISITPPTKVECLHYRSQSNTIWGGCRDGSVICWDRETGAQTERYMNVHRGPIKQILDINDNLWTISTTDGISVSEGSNLSPKDPYLKLSGYLQVYCNGRWKRRWVVLEDGVMAMFKTEEDKESIVGTINLRHGQVTSLQMREFAFVINLPSDENFYFACEENEVKKEWMVGIIITIKRLQELDSVWVNLKGSAQKQISCALNLDDCVWLGCSDNTIEVVRNREFETRWRLNTNEFDNEQHPISHLLKVKDNVWATINNEIVILSQKNVIATCFKAHDGNISDIIATPTSVWSCGDDKCIKIWNSVDYSLVKSIPMQAFCLLSVGTDVWSGGWCHKICVWNQSNGAARQQLPSLHTSGISCLVSASRESLQGDNQAVWTTSWDKTICVWI
eukprot:TRINITY_DN7810_c0_g1_i1.p1 TRINITY_DN7810_c0_g1~~TRINITY_DN7810_c0_g1_i1.p1  ORF type:complete len:751 (-),score=131.19 TRINITY_DN7810_c0_g1_i1:100-2352(-)